jgi:hypothetical protein
MSSNKKRKLENEKQSGSSDESEVHRKANPIEKYNNLSQKSNPACTFKISMQSFAVQA